MYGEYEQVNGAVANALQAEIDALKQSAWSDKAEIAELVEALKCSRNILKKVYTNPRDYETIHDIEELLAKHKGE